MAEARQARTTLDIAPRAIVKLLVAVVLVWLWLRLWPLLMLVVVALVLAIGLEPIVYWIERRGVPRWVASSGTVLVLALLVGGFFWITGSQLAGQARELGARVTQVEETLLTRAPHWVVRAVRRNQASALPDASTMANSLLVVARYVLSGALVGVLALILTIYLLIEGRQTYAWLLAYVPPAYRERADVTASEARRKIHGYVAGNVATSVFATIFVFVTLTILKVPAALLLAVLAGVFDFVPVLGFICSAAPAILLAMMRSGTVAIIVACLYASYHLIENYYIGPRVYGDRLRLSNLAVIIAFAVGAEIGGVVGALLALPFAALYPVVERVWLSEYLSRDAVETHTRLERHGKRH